MTIDEAIFAGGCFWCTEAVFNDIAGVHSVESGYIGGEKPDPTYREVCSGTKMTPLICRRCIAQATAAP